MVERDSVEPTTLAAMVERDSVEPTTLAAMVGRDSVEPTTLAAMVERDSVEPMTLAAMVGRDSVEPTTLAAMVGRDSVEPTIFDGSADVCVSRDLPLKIAQPRRLSGLGFSGQEIQSPLYGTEELCLFGGAPFVPEATRIFSSHDIPSVKTLG